MNALDKFAEKWEEYLNSDVVVKRRIEHVNSAIEEGRAVAEVDIKDRGVFTVELKGNKFHLRSGRGSKPLLSWVVPATLFREMLLGKERILYAMLDKECTLSFDTPHFTHWDGITALAVILAAQEMVKNVPEAKKLAEEM